MDSAAARRRMTTPQEKGRQAGGIITSPALGVRASWHGDARTGHAGDDRAARGAGLDGAARDARAAGSPDLRGAERARAARCGATGDRGDEETPAVARAGAH